MKWTKEAKEAIDLACEKIKIKADQFHEDAKTMGEGRTEKANILEDLITEIKSLPTD